MSHIEERAWSYRDSFAGIVQGNCEECGNCEEDADGNCACDRIVNELIGAIVRIEEEAASLSADRSSAAIKAEDATESLHRTYDPLSREYDDEIVE